jgi:hypothetical protein
MAKISELPVGNDLLLTDEIPANRNGTNIKILGKDVLTAKLRYPQPINLSGVVVGGAIFDGASSSNISTTLGPIASGISDKVAIIDGSGYFKSRDINPFVWNTNATPLTGQLNAKYIPKALTPNTLINSAIVESDLNDIGIRIYPTVELTVGGQISATNSISTNVDLSAHGSLFVAQHTILGNNIASTNILRGVTTFPQASSSSLGVKFNTVKIYGTVNDTLKIDGKLAIGQLDITTLSDSVVTEEAGLLKYRPINPRVWNTTTTFIEGGGNTNFIPRYTSANSIQDSIICEKSTNIGIGTHSPSEKLTVNGSIAAVGLKLSDDYIPDSGISFGNNVNLYRADDFVLRTDQNLIIGTIIKDTTVNDVLVQKDGLVKQREINKDSWDTTKRLVRGDGPAQTIPMFSGNATIQDSNIKQTFAGDIQINQNLFVGSSNINVEQEINDLKSVHKEGCSFYSLKPNDGSVLNPNIPVPLFSYTEKNPARSAQTFISPDNLVTLYNPALLKYPGTNIDVSLIESFLIKFKVKARLERPKGNIEIQVRRRSVEPWIMNSGIINLVAEDFSDTYRVYSVTNEIIFHDKPTGTFEWRLLDLDTDTFLAPFSVQNVEYNVSAEVLGFYFKLS